MTFLMEPQMSLKTDREVGGQILMQSCLLHANKYKISVTPLLVGIFLCAS